jgi:hypothetical protein
MPPSSSSSGSPSSSSGSSGGSGGPGVNVPTGSPESALLPALISLMQTGASPQALAAQQALLRRLVLEGDVIPSRLPAPKNITEIGGYLNLLTRLGQTTMRAEVLASVLGVAPPAGLLAGSTGHPLAMVSMPNDRPSSGPAQATTPLTWYVRSDFQSAFQSALNRLHAQGALLPLYNPPTCLPPAAPAFSPPNDWLPYIGREVLVFPGAALVDPTTDAVVLASPTSGGPYQLMVNVTSGGTSSTWNALQATAGVVSEVAVTTSLLQLSSILAVAGFYPISSLAAPATTSDITWATVKNITGLITGVTTLGSELKLLFDPNEIGASGVMPFLNYVWNGATFSAQ